MVDFTFGRNTTQHKSITSTSAGASADVVYTVPSKYISQVTFLLLGNGGSATKKVYVQRYIATSTSYAYIINGMDILQYNVASVVDGSTLSLQSGDKICAYKEAGSTFDITISATEYYNPTGG
tara:strand:- start:4323 stop:4691 length:369 start_codon:yes stop_codon:yes gene_type:complete